MVQCQGVPRLNGGPKSFFVSPVLTGNCNENLQSARGPAQCTSSLGKNMITVVIGLTNNHLLYQWTFNNNSPPTRQFLRDKMLLKKKQLEAKMRIKQIFEFKLRGSGPLSHYMYSYN